MYSQVLILHFLVILPSLKNIHMKHSVKIWINCIIGLIFLGAATATIITHIPEKEEKAKYIFLFIGDGMGSPIVSLTESYMSYKAGRLGGERLSFSNFPCFGSVTTHSADRVITCSAAAGTAIATGHKTNNGLLGRSPAGEPLRSFSYDLKEDGYKIGILTNTPVNHATPACFYSNPEKRHHHYRIIQDLAASGFDFIAGTGFKGYFGNCEEDPDCEKLLEDAGYQIYWGKQEYAQKGSDSEKTILCQAHNKGIEAHEYFVDGFERENDFKLEDLIKACIDSFGDEEPFFIMCEGGTIDWIAHTNKTIPTVKLVQEMDEAVKIAYEFYLKHPDETLIIVTADHDTGGVAMGYGNQWMGDALHWRILDSAWNAAGGRNTLEWEENRKLNESAFIGWPTSHHTGDNVPVYAIGKGAERFCGKMDNTDFKGKILAE